MGNSESWEAQLSRLELMASGDPKWNLADADRQAIREALVRLRLLVTHPLGLGATGQYPAGRLIPGDQGEIQIAVGHVPGNVVLRFGKEVSWIGFDPAFAHTLVDSLLKHASQAEAEAQ